MTLQSEVIRGEVHAADEHPHGLTRWFNSTNHKDIGSMYLVFAAIAALIGGAMSVMMRAELAHPGLQFFSDKQFYNVIVTAHALIMIFFFAMPAL